MSQPMHLRAPATHASARITPRPTPSPLLDDWSSLSTLAMPVIAPACHATRRFSWPRLNRMLSALPLPARKA